MNVSLMQLMLRLKQRCVAKEADIRRRFKLSPAEYSCLLVLESGKPVNGAGFAGLAGLSASRASRVMTKLLKSAFVTVEQCAANRREVEILLTARGESVKNGIASEFAECERGIMDAVPISERPNVNRVLSLLIELI